MAHLRLIPPFGAPIDVTRDVAVVGREPGCDVLVADGSVSRKHARIERRGTAWFVLDQGSANGTFLDSQRVADAMLRPGQELRFGAVSFRIEISGDVPAADGTVFTPQGATFPPAPPPPARSPAHAAPPPAHQPPRPPPPPYPPSPPPPPSTPRPARIAPAQPAAEAPPPRAGRGPFFWVAMGCGGCLLVVVAAIAVLIGGPVGLVYFSTKGSAEAARAQVADLKEGRFDDAYARLSEEYQSQVPVEALRAFAERHPGLSQNADTTFNNRSFNNDRAELRGSLAAASGQTESVVYRLRKEAGDWRITGIEVAGDRPESGATVPVQDVASASGGLQIETLDVSKRRDGSVVRVAVRVNVSGFGVRPEGSRFAIDLAEDVETLDPEGIPIPALSKTDVQRVQRTTSLESGAVVPVTTTLTLAAGSPPGRYTVRVAFRDLVSGQQASHEAAFDLP